MLARQLGWYHSKPDNSKKTRAIQLEEPELILPQCEDEFQVLLFYESGMYDLGGMGGIQPLSWLSLNCWETGTERNIGFYRRKLLLEMSAAYVDEYNLATSEPLRPRPYSVYIPPTEDEMKKAAEAQKKALLAVAAAMDAASIKR